MRTPVYGMPPSGLEALFSGQRGQILSCLRANYNCRCEMTGKIKPHTTSPAVCSYRSEPGRSRACGQTILSQSGHLPLLPFRLLTPLSTFGIATSSSHNASSLFCLLGDSGWRNKKRNLCCLTGKVPGGIHGYDFVIISQFRR